MWPLLAAGAVTAYAAYAAAWPSASRWGKNIHRLPTRERRLALTFDDGPSNETPRFLELLDRLDVPATFFVCGKNVDRRPRIARSIVSAGHRIANHSYSHPKLITCGPRRVREELSRTQLAIEDATGAQPTLFRPPYGLRAPALRSVQDDLGLLGVSWTVIGNDWKWPTRRIVSRVVDRAAPGGIVCLHDGHDTRETVDRQATLDAVGEIVARLRDQGYEFVAIDT